MARSLSYRDRTTWINIYKVYVRPHLEYAVQSWSPYTKADIDVLEDVQRRAVRMTSGLTSATYEGKLAELNLLSLEDRRARGDMIQTWKILHGHDNVKIGTWFKMSSHKSCEIGTRFSSSVYNIEPKRFNLDVRKHFFSVRVVNEWNKLPECVKSATTLNAFKNLYDNHRKADALKALQ